jgi:hypothetical protein
VSFVFFFVFFVVNFRGTCASDVFRSKLMGNKSHPRVDLPLPEIAPIKNAHSYSVLAKAWMLVWNAGGAQ